MNIAVILLLLIAAIILLGYGLKKLIVLPQFMLWTMQNKLDTLKEVVEYDKKILIKNPEYADKLNFDDDPKLKKLMENFVKLFSDLDKLGTFTLPLCKNVKYVQGYEKLKEEFALVQEFLK